MVLLLALIAVLLVLLTHEQEKIVEQEIKENQISNLEYVLPTYNPIDSVIQRIKDEQSDKNVQMQKNKVKIDDKSKTGQ